MSLYWIQNQQNFRFLSGHVQLFICTIYRSLDLSWILLLFVLVT